MENRESLHLECDKSKTALEEAARDYGIEVPNIRVKGYEVLIYKQKENIWEERKFLFLLYKYYIFKCWAGKKEPNTRLKKGVKNSKNKNIINNLIPVWSGKELEVEHAEELSAEASNNHEMTTILNDSW